KLWTAESLPFLQNLVQTHSWWDTVDVIAAHMVGATVYNMEIKSDGSREISSASRILDESWIKHENLWVRRSAILHQLNFKEATNFQRLFNYCDLCKHETDFFIRKAIGWALRQASYIDAEKIREYVETNESSLSTLSCREALK